MYSELCHPAGDAGVACHTKYGDQYKPPEMSAEIVNEHREEEKDKVESNSNTTRRQT